ncbi:hypothetical protein QVD99_007759 [Batrachochytrium dendrobatidis]|nr:hypothetical protein O5D80_001414 [Batrachochytrium dendrobatidis]KAK5665407.1 hypothetical protein QVD99_007759 [Batrachochytrium dendrobatidis]
MNELQKNLPIYQYRDSLVAAIKEYQFLVVVGDTGSGKTTQLPQYILQDLSDSIHNIVVTQPRRIAAISAATRVSEEHQTKLGDLIGYTVRFEKCLSASTRLTYVTDGILLRQCTADRQLASYDLVILDEAHERSLETDILFGLLRRACRLRPALKVVIMSATLDIDEFSSFFNDCPVFSVPGRMFTVDILWQKNMNFAVLKASFVNRCVETCMQIHCEEQPGDILVFLTGQQEIETAMQRIMEAHQDLDYNTVRYNNDVSNIVVYPIYSTLESIEQRAIFHPPPPTVRKIVLATNIAQTSVTVPGIRYVVDSGFVKQKMYDSQTYMDALVIVPISQAAATQRAGRAGRTEHGRVYRLYSREAFEEMDKATVPEIKRSSLLGTVLQLKKMGIDDVLNFEFIDPPDPDLVIAATKQLFLLSAVDEHGHLTPLGKQMSELPCSPFLTRALISAAVDFHCAYDVVTIVAMLSSEEVFSTPRSKKRQSEADEAHQRFYHYSGDHMTLLQVYNAWVKEGYSRDWCIQNYLHYRALKNAKSIRSQLVDIMKRLQLHVDIGEKAHGNSPALKTTLHSHHHKRDHQDDLYNHKDRKRKHHDHHNSEAVDEIALNHTPNTISILKSICTAFYPNTSKRHPTRPIFIPYLASIVLSNTSTQQIALYIHQKSALYSSDIAKMNQLDWVVYNDIQYVNRACMRIVSRVNFSMVEVLCQRVKLLNVSKLLGNEPRKSILSEADKDVGSDDGSNTIPVGFDLVEEVIDEQHHTEHPAGDSDKEPAVPTVQVHERLQLHPAGKHNTLGDEDKTMRQEKIDSARDRFLKRKGTRR